MLTEAALLSSLLVTPNPTELPIRKEEIHRIQVIRPATKNGKEALSFSQLVNNEPGLEAQTACAFCGAKRLSINGMKGEHTSILVDGLPLHSTISSFYATDAIPVEVIEAIDVYRGTGQALTAPESIGGALNLITREIIGTEARIRLSGADTGDYNTSFLGTKRLDENSGFLIGLQVGASKPTDRDSNRVSESPTQQIANTSLKWQQKLGFGELSLRYGFSRLKTLGGSMTGFETSKAPTALADSSDFAGGDVRQAFTGAEEKISDSVHLDRHELAAIQDIELADSARLRLAVAGAFQDQRAIYSHGYDYNNRDTVALTKFEYQKPVGESHLVTLGMDLRREWMLSKSEVLYEQKGLRKDDLTHDNQGLYFQDTWIQDENNEWAFALRLDRLNTEWVQLDHGVDKVLFSPRLFYKHRHNAEWSSRFSMGRGYRSPLTLFESQHGSDHYGFDIQVQDVETAESLTYSLAAQRLDDFFEVGTHFTRIHKMAYGEDHADTEEPTIFKNSDEDYVIQNFEIGYGRRLWSKGEAYEWGFEILAESFNSPDSYKNKLPVATLESRISLSSNLSFGKWKSSQKLTYFGPRNLSKYGYDSHYNRAAMDDDITSPTFGEVSMNDQKRQEAPGYFNLDISLETKLDQNLSLGLSILNALDYTQAKTGDGPLTWDLHGHHYHLDNFHLWGPLRGRQFFVSLSGQW